MAILLFFLLQVLKQMKQCLIPAVSISENGVLMMN